MTALTLYLSLSLLASIPLLLVAIRGEVAYVRSKTAGALVGLTTTVVGIVVFASGPTLQVAVWTAFHSNLSLAIRWLAEGFSQAYIIDAVVLHGILPGGVTAAACAYTQTVKQRVLRAAIAGPAALTVADVAVLLNQHATFDWSLFSLLSNVVGGGLGGFLIAYPTGLLRATLREPRVVRVRLWRRATKAAGVLVAITAFVLTILYFIFVYRLYAQATLDLDQWSTLQLRYADGPGDVILTSQVARISFDSARQEVGLALRPSTGSLADASVEIPLEVGEAIKEVELAEFHSSTRASGSLVGRDNVKAIYRGYAPHRIRLARIDASGIVFQMQLGDPSHPGRVDIHLPRGKSVRFTSGGEVERFWRLEVGSLQHAVAIVTQDMSLKATVTGVGSIFSGTLRPPGATATGRERWEIGLGANQPPPTVDHTAVLLVLGQAQTSFTVETVEPIDNLLLETSRQQFEEASPGMTFVTDVTAVGRGRLTVSGEAHQLERRFDASEEITIAGRGLVVRDLDSGGLTIRGHSNFVLANGMMLTTTLWGSLRGEMRAGIVTAVIGAIALALFSKEGHKLGRSMREILQRILS